MSRLSTVAIGILVLATCSVLSANPKKDTAPVQTTLEAAWDSLLTPTYEWVNLYCGAPTLDGVALNPGDTIAVYDPNGVLAGIDTVQADGSFGFMPVYRDDAYSDADEGALPDDTLSFVINGVPVTTASPVIWTMMGDAFEVCRFFSEEDETATVLVDIKPGSCPNPFNVNGNLDAGKSVLPVAILGTADFDVYDIDPSTITLAGASVVRWNYEDVSSPVVDPEDSCSCTNERGDGFVDLTLKFYRSEVAMALDQAADREYVSLLLTGELYDGTAIEGGDCVRVQRNDKENEHPGGPNGKATVAGEFTLGNHPNPFNPSTTISFSLPQAGMVSLRIYDVSGRLVRTLTDAPLAAGNHSVVWDGADEHGTPVATGVYFYRLSAGKFEMTKKMLLVK